MGSHQQAPASLHQPPMGAQMVGGAPVPSPGQASARPGLDRAHTFPTPPASASSVVNMGAQGPPYDSWSSNVSSMPPAQQLSIDTGLSNQRSVPNTPASTPPGKSTQGATHYPTPQSYDASRTVYSNPAPQGQYQSQVRFGGPLQSTAYQQKSKIFTSHYFGAITNNLLQQKIKITNMNPNILMLQTLRTVAVSHRMLIKPTLAQLLPVQKCQE
jgi:hypothetical protein